MRKLLFASIFFLLITVPASAEVVEPLDVEITIENILIFTINNPAALTHTFNEFEDFGVANDIGDVTYDLTCNQEWTVVGKILDNGGGGQINDDWDSVTWTLSVNGVTIGEAGPATLDGDGSGAHRDNSAWEVLLAIPWPESASTADCMIQLTATPA